MQKTSAICAIIAWGILFFATYAHGQSYEINGSALSPSYSFVNATGTGLYIQSSGALRYSVNSVNYWAMGTVGALTPAITNSYDIGNGSLRVRTIYVGTGINVNGIQVCLADGTNCPSMEETNQLIAGIGYLLLIGLGFALGFWVTKK